MKTTENPKQGTDKIKLMLAEWEAISKPVQDPLITCIVPYYNQPAMLQRHLSMWFDNYPNGVHEYVRLMIVDDGSQKTPALDVIEKWGHRADFLATNSKLLRIKQDIPWNRGGARNLGSILTSSPLLLHIDIDHIVPVGTMSQLPAFAQLMHSKERTKREFYRFPRDRRGRADHTRQKDALPPSAVVGAIKPHVDSYLVARDQYWLVGGYDERYSGCLGGGTPFLQQLEQRLTAVVAPSFLRLEVHTSHSVPDANTDLDRTPGEFSTRRRRIQAENTAHQRPLLFNFDWERQL